MFRFHRQTKHSVIAGCHSLLAIAAGWVREGGGDVDWIDLAHNRDKSRTRMNTVMNPRVP